MMSPAYRSLTCPMAWALLLVAGLAAGGAHAERADRLKPIVIEADSGTLDDGRNTSTLVGNVVITQGSMQLRAARVEMIRSADEQIIATATGGPNGRASFRQRRDAPGEWVEGEADTVVFDGRTDTLRLQRRAVMRRLVNGQLADEVLGDTIVRDGRADRYTVDGGPSAATSGGKPGAEPGTGQRLRLMITPKSALTPDDAGPNAHPSNPPHLKPSAAASRLPFDPHSGTAAPANIAGDAASAANSAPATPRITPLARQPAPPSAPQSAPKPATTPATRPATRSAPEAKP